MRDHEGRVRLLIGLFVYGILAKFMLLTATFDREFINYDYLGEPCESKKSGHSLKDCEKVFGKLMN